AELADRRIDRLAMAFEIGKVADAHFAQDHPLADRGVAAELACLQLRGRMDARLGVLEDEVFRAVHDAALRRQGRSRKRGLSRQGRSGSYGGLPLVHTTFWP